MVNQCNPDRCVAAGREITFPAVMGVVNTTPDSFSDGGTLYKSTRLDLDKAFDRCVKMVEEGATILDIGGESTRPGSDPVSVEQELERVIPLVERLARSVDVALSLDTSTPQVMREGSQAGAHIINDVRALRREGALEAAARTDLAVCLMHMQGEPKTMQTQPAYGDVVQDVSGFLNQRIKDCLSAGIDKKRLWVDPGFGFGKTLTHNIELMQNISYFCNGDYPVLVGVSRKSMIGAITGKDVNERLAGGLALATFALMQGAHIIRTHDVSATVDAVNVVKALKGDQ
jgi:dihydropteroate synthase